MLSHFNIRIFYFLSILFIAVSLIAVFFEFYVLLALPLVVILLLVFVYKPKLLLYFLPFATPLSIQLSASQNIFSLSIPTEPIIILLFIGVLFKLLQARSIPLDIFTSLLSILIITDFTWLIVSSLSSTMPLISLKYILSKMWYLVVFYFLLVHLFNKQKVVKIFMWCFISATVILALYTLYNHSLGSFSRSYAYTAMRPFLPDHGMYAAAVSFAVPILFVFAIHGQSLKYSMPTRVIAFALCAFLILAVALSFTRASWLSLVVAFAVYLALILKIKFRYLIFLSIIAVGFLAVNFEDLFTELSRNKSESDDNIEEHLQSVSNVTSDPSNLERLNRWSCAFRMWQDRPILGFGPGTYTFQYGVYQLPHETTIISTNSGDLGNVHSEYLRPLVESGILGFLLFVAIVISTCFMGFHQFKHLEGGWRYLSLASFLALITYFTHGVLNNYSEFDKIAVPLYAFLAVLTSRQIWLKSKQKDVKEISTE